VATQFNTTVAFLAIVEPAGVSVMPVTTGGWLPLGVNVGSGGVVAGDGVEGGANGEEVASGLSKGDGPVVPFDSDPLPQPGTKRSARTRRDTMTARIADLLTGMNPFSIDYARWRRHEQRPCFAICHGASGSA
jgi:hypothetical protein